MSDQFKKRSFFWHYNPIIQFAIRPALRLVNASENPFFGGVAAAIASFIAHNIVGAIIVVIVCQVNAFDVLRHISIQSQIFFAISALSNFAMGLQKQLQRKS